MLPLAVRRVIVAEILICRVLSSATVMLAESDLPVPEGRPDGLTPGVPGMVIEGPPDGLAPGVPGMVIDVPPDGTPDGPPDGRPEELPEALWNPSTPLILFAESRHFFCKYIRIKESVFWETIRKFANPILFDLSNGMRPTKKFKVGVGLLK